MVKIIKKLIENSSLTELEAEEVIEVMVEKHGNVSTDPDEVLIDFQNSCEIHDNRLEAWKDSESYFTEEEFNEVCNELSTGRVVIC